MFFTVRNSKVAVSELDALRIVTSSWDDVDVEVLPEKVVIRLGKDGKTTTVTGKTLEKAVEKVFDLVGLT